MKTTLILLAICLTFSMTFQKWKPTAALRKLLAVNAQLSSKVQGLYNAALHSEILAQKSLHIGGLKSLVRRLHPGHGKKNKKENKSPQVTKEALANTTPVSQNPIVAEALNNWFMARNEVTIAQSKVQMLHSDLQSAVMNNSEAVYNAFTSKKATTMCSKIAAARKAHTDIEKVTKEIKNKMKEAKKPLKLQRVASKAAYGKLIEVTNSELGAAPKRRNQAVERPIPTITVPEGDDNTKMMGEDDMPKCEGKDSELCNAFMEFMGARGGEFIAKINKQELRFSRKEMKNSCVMDMEAAAFPEDKSKSGASWGALLKGLKMCTSASNKKNNRAMKAAISACKEAHKAAKLAEKAFHGLAEQTCAASAKPAQLRRTYSKPY